MFLKELNGIAEKENKPHIFHRDGFVLLTDDCKCRLARIESISILEAFRNATLVHFAEENFLIRRSLVECERRLDTSIFFRASRDCIVNLSQVKQARLLQDGGLIFLLKDGKEVLFSRRQSTLFRKIRGLQPQFRVQREELATCVREPIMAVRKLKQKNGETLWTLPYPSGEVIVISGVL